MQFVSLIEEKTMILDIRFTDSGPVQYQHVRMTTIYTRPDSDSGPELVIHFHDVLYPMMNIPLARITHVVVTND